MLFVVDSIEGNFARCENEDGENFILEISRLPKDIKAQDWIEEKNGEFFINKKFTEDRKTENLELYKKLKGL